MIEGWANPSTFDRGVEAIRSQQYDRCFVTGGPIEPESPLITYGNYAALGAYRLASAGVPTVTPIPADWVRKDRTYASAMALRAWLRARGEAPAEITVLTQGPHARRTRLLFQKAFGAQTRVGVIASVEPGFNGCWWDSSEAFRNVSGEAIAYLYARLFFWSDGG